MQKLLEAGATADFQNNKGDSPLHLVVAHGYLPCFEDEDEDEAEAEDEDEAEDENKKDHAAIAETKCCAAVRARELKETVRALLDAGAAVNMQNSEGMTPLHKAALYRHPNWIEALLEAGAAVNLQNSEGMTPLHEAARVINHEGVVLLLEAGATATLQNNKGDSPLHLATAHKGPSQGHWESENEWKHRVAERTRDMVETVRALLEAGAEANMQNNDGRSSLHVSIMRGHIGVTRILLEAGAAVNLQDSEGVTSLLMGAQRGHVGVTEMLLKAGAEANLQDKDGRSPLLAVAYEGHMAFARMLVEVQVQRRD
eukprot:5143772-Pyramimonas_sp.AAC.1